MANLPPNIRLAVFAGIALLALAIRLPRLGERPMHTDEAVNAYITGQLLDGGTYRYDPRDRHGPALYALALPVARVAGAKSFADLTEPVLRFGAVLAGAATVLLFASGVRPGGWLSAAMAAALFAIGPLTVYYNRYFIHESLFVAATLGFLLSGWRVIVWGAPAHRSVWSPALGRPGPAVPAMPPEGGTTSDGSFGLRWHLWSAAAGFWAGLMLACKETAFLHFAAFAGAATWWIFPAFRGQRTVEGQTLRRGTRLLTAVLVMLAAFLALVVLTYTWGGRHWRGPVDLVRAMPGFASRAAGQGHEKPFGYYLVLLAGGWGGAPVLALALIGALSSFKRTSATDAAKGGDIDGCFGSAGFFRFVAVYTVVIFVIYSAIPYKTPWLALNIWLPISLLAGRAVAFVWRAAKSTWPRGAVALMVCAVLTALGRDSWQRALVDPAGEGNPYAYAHTGEDLLRLPARVGQLARQNPARENLRIAVVCADPWPLPWYLRRFPQTGFWQPFQDPGPADLYVTAAEPPDLLRPRLANWRPEYFGLRPGVLVVLWSPSGALRHE